jgi:hypothetical protein
MSNSLSSDYRGLDLRTIAHDIDGIFGFPSNWESTPGPSVGCWEYRGRIVIDLGVVDKLCQFLDAGPGDIGHTFRYVLAHLKAHHYQELNPNYSKLYAEDIRPYELDADLIAGWICANARIPNSFRTHGVAAAFNDFSRRELSGENSEPKINIKPLDYPWPEERDLAFQRGARIWAAGQISSYNSATTKQGMPDETFHEFLAQVPTIVNGMWSRPLPKAA